MMSVGKPEAPGPVPFWLKLEKSQNQFTGYTRKKEGEDWQNVGELVRDIKKPKYVGIGILNHWDNQNLTLIADSFSMEGEKVKPSSAVSPKGKLASRWGYIKRR